MENSMDQLARNADGDELLFIHQGSGDLFCDYGHLEVHEGDYIVIPRCTVVAHGVGRTDADLADRGQRRQLLAAGQGHARAARDFRSGCTRYARDR